MTISEKVAYIKGLAEGMDVDTQSKEGKILTAIIDVLGDICDEIDALDDAQIELAEQLDAVDEDLSDVEELIYEDYDDEDECGCYDDDDDEVFEVVCPNCNDKIYLDEEMLMDGRIDCPNCGTDLEFEFDCDCDCEDCNCDDCNVED